MPDLKSSRPDLELPENRDLLAHWEALRGADAVPLRTKFNPMDKPKHLPNLIVLEPSIPDSANIRIFGTALARRLGLDLTGQNLFSLYEGERADQVVEMIACVVNQTAVAVAYSEWTTPSGNKFTTENMWMPLASQDGSINRVLGSIWDMKEPSADLDDLGGGVSQAQRLSRRSFYKF
ncbi:MAG: PAS domain-containing protein [Candidatus Phaeomarinobacter sp.]